MSDELDRVAVAAAAREAAQAEWVAALRAAASVHTLQVVGDAVGLTRARVSQIVGPVGRPAGRPARKVDPSAAMSSRLDELDTRWESFIDHLHERFMPAENVRKSEQAYRNGQNARARRQASGKTRAGKWSGASSWASTVRPTVTAEARRAAESFALRYLEEHSTHPICVKVLRELDEAASLREQLQAIQDARVPFLHD